MFNCSQDFFDHTDQKDNKSLFFGSKSKIGVCFLLVLLGVVIAQPAEAGFLSKVVDLFSSSEDKDKAIPNSQNMALLQAAVSLEPNPNKGGSDPVVVGGTALMAETGPMGTQADVEMASSTTNQLSVYVIHEGDTLPVIAKMYGVSPETIAWANDLKSSQKLIPGERLLILPVDGVIHTVKKGDTVKSIAKKYKVEPEDILSYNDLPAEGDLAVGDTLIVPEGEITPTPSSTTKKKTTTKKAPSAYRGPDLGGYFLRPVGTAGRKSQGLHGHNGIDIAAPAGTPIYAAASGRVILARSGGWNGGYGNYVIIQHSNGTKTLYAHMTSVYAQTGQTVSRGQAIGSVGNTGRSTGNHLHFEVYGAVNPF